MRTQLRAIATGPDGNERQFAVTGQVARTLKALVDAGPQGVTTLDIAATWALRTSHYVYVLRRNHGLDIAMCREDHHGPSGAGWHGRYTLLTRVCFVGQQSEQSEAA